MVSLLQEHTPLSLTKMVQSSRAEMFFFFFFVLDFCVRYSADPSDAVHCEQFANPGVAGPATPGLVDCSQFDLPLLRSSTKVPSPKHRLLLLLLLCCCFMSMVNSHGHVGTVS